MKKRSVLVFVLLLSALVFANLNGFNDPGHALLEKRRKHHWNLIKSCTSSLSKLTDRIEDNPKDLDAQLELSKTYSKLSMFQSARKHAEIALRLNPQSDQAHCAYALALFQSGKEENAERALDEYLEALKLNGQSKDALSGAAILYAHYGDYAEAIKKVSAALNLDSDDSAARTVNSLCLTWLSGLPESGLEESNKALSLDPFNSGAFLASAWSQYRLKDFTSMLSNATEAALLDPAQSDPYVCKSIALNNLGRYKDGLCEANMAVILSPDKARPYLCRAWSNLEMLHYQKALEDCTYALSISPKFAVAHYLKGRAQSGLRKYKDGLADYDRALSILNEVLASGKETIGKNQKDLWAEPGQNALLLKYEIMLLKANLLKILHDDAQAASINKEVIAGCNNLFNQLSPFKDGTGTIAEFSSQKNKIAHLDDMAQAKMLSALACANLGDMFQAAKHALFAGVLSPRWARPHNVRVFCLLCLGYPLEAEKEANASVALAPEDAYSHAMLSYVLQQRGKNQAAFKAAKRATELNANLSEGWSALSFSTQNGEKAYKYAQNALSLDPFSVSANMAYAWSASLLHQNEKAIELAQDAVNADHFNPDALSFRAFLLGKLGRDEAARDDILKALKLCPQSAKLHYTLAYIYNNLRKYQDAVKEASQALAINNKLPDAYRNRAQAYQQLGKEQEANMDWSEAERAEKFLNNVR